MEITADVNDIQHETQLLSFKIFLIVAQQGDSVKTKIGSAEKEGESIDIRVNNPCLVAGDRGNATVSAFLFRGACGMIKDVSVDSLLAGDEAPPAPVVQLLPQEQSRDIKNMILRILAVFARGDKVRIKSAVRNSRLELLTAERFHYVTR